MTNFKKLTGIIVFGAIIISFAAAGGGQDNSKPGIPEKWQNTYIGTSSGDTFVINANSGTLTISGNTQSFDDLNIKGGGQFTDFGIPDGTWAYLYNGNTKLGYIQEVEYVGVSLYIGRENTQRSYEILGHMNKGLEPTPDFSDIPADIPDWIGDIE